MQDFTRNYHNHCFREHTLFPDDVNFDIQRIVKCRSSSPGHGACLKGMSRKINMQGFILA